MKSPRKKKNTKITNFLRLIPFHSTPFSSSIACVTLLPEFVKSTNGKLNTIRGQAAYHNCIGNRKQFHFIRSLPFLVQFLQSKRDHDLKSVFDILRKMHAIAIEIPPAENGVRDENWESPDRVHLWSNSLLSPLPNFWSLFPTDSSNSLRTDWMLSLL